MQLNAVEMDVQPSILPLHRSIILPVFSTNIPLRNIYLMPGRRCGDPAGSNGSLQEHLGGSGISYGTREKAQHIKWSKLSGIRVGRLCAQEIKQC